MRHYTAHEVISSGRPRIDVRLDGVEVVTFYPSSIGGFLWIGFQQMVRDNKDMLTIKTAYTGIQRDEE